MPSEATSEMKESESRAANVGRHALAGATATPLATSTSSSTLHSATSSPRSTSSKKRKRGKKKSSDVKDFVPMGATFPKSSDILQHSTSSSNNTAIARPSSSQPTPDHEVVLPNMGTSTSSLGKNRLASGFNSSPTSARTPDIDKSRTLSHSSHDTSGGSKDDAIEISSDEEMEDSEGGMIVNVHDNVPDLTNGSVSEDEGIIRSSDDDDILQIHEDLSRAADVKDSADATLSNLRLLDLNPDDLEEQIKYGFYHLDRTQVDLNRLAVCLSCMELGHLVSDCPEATCKHCEESGHPSRLCPSNSRCRKCRDRGHSSQDCVADLKVTTVPCDVCGRLSHVEQECPDRHFLQPILQGPVRLWISCAICASKSHLVGDCPNAPASASTARWSLKELDPSQITNLSLESGIRQLEQVAETRGMRPAGMQIRGRAGLHHTGDTRLGAGSDDEDDFLRPAVGRSNQPPKPQVRLGNYEPRHPAPSYNGQSDRYDRFDAPSFDERSQNRGRGAWYDTDSFGRRRSRSPVLDSYRPGSRRSPSPRRFDGYTQSGRGFGGPPQSDYWRPTQGGLPPRPPPTRANAAPPIPAHSRPVQLPTRKGSNPNLPFKPPTAVQDSQQKQTASKSRSKKSKKGKRAGQADSNIIDSDDDQDDGDFSVLGSLTTNDLNFTSDGTICLDLPDNLQAWLDKVNSKRSKKGKKLLFVSDVDDNPRPSEMELYDAQTGQTTKMKASQCFALASKGFKLLGKPDEVEPAKQNGQQGDNNKHIAADAQQGVQGRCANRKNGVFSRDSGPEAQARKRKKTLAPIETHHVVAAEAVRPKVVRIPETLVNDHSESNVRTPRATTTKKQKIELSAWLELENRLRRAQGKGPITIKRAHTVDTRGHYIHSYLIDPATGAYQAVRDKRYGRMRLIDALLRLQIQQHGAQRGMLPELQEYLSSMRGQALPQSAPAEFSAAIRAATSKAASEGRQLLLSNLPLDVTAVSIDRFFAGFDGESIAIAYDSITETPIGAARVDMKTSKDAEAVFERLSGKSITGKVVTMKFNTQAESEDLAQLADFQVHPVQAQNNDYSMVDSTMTDAVSAAEDIEGVAGVGDSSHMSDEVLEGPAEAAELADVSDDGSQTGPANSAVRKAKRKHVKGSRSKRYGYYLEMVNEERAALQLSNLTQAPGVGKKRRVFIHDPDTNRRTKVDREFRCKVKQWRKGDEKEKRKARALAAAEARQVCRALGMPTVAHISTPDGVAETPDEVAGDENERCGNGRSGSMEVAERELRRKPSAMMR